MRDRQVPDQPTGGFPDHHVQINADLVSRLLDFLQRPNGALRVNDRLTVEAVAGGGVLVITSAYRDRTQRPEKPRRPPRDGSGVSPPSPPSTTMWTGTGSIVETCSCGSSFAIPHFIFQYEQVLARWREEHLHETPPRTDA